MLTGAQIRAARALLAWNQADLAAATGLALSTIRRLEAESGVLQSNVATLVKIKDALTTGGVEFIDGNGGGPGVRLRS